MLKDDVGDDSYSLLKKPHELGYYSSVNSSLQESVGPGFSGSESFQELDAEDSKSFSQSHKSKNESGNTSSSETEESDNKFLNMLYSHFLSVQTKIFEICVEKNINVLSPSNITSNYIIPSNNTSISQQTGVSITLPTPSHYPTSSSHPPASSSSHSPTSFKPHRAAVVNAVSYSVFITIVHNMIVRRARRTSAERDPPRFVVVGFEDGGVGVLDGSSLLPVCDITGLDSRITRMAFAHDGYTLVVLGEKKRLQILDMRSLRKKIVCFFYFCFLFYILFFIFIVFFKVEGLDKGAEDFVDKIFENDKYEHFKKESFKLIIQKHPVVDEECETMGKSDCNEMVCVC
jgi:hypothetical protein